MVWIYIWLGVIVVSLVIEFITFELVSVWISVGALVAMIMALCGVMPEIQISVAVVLSIVCLLALRKVTLKFLTKNKDKTNVDAAIGKVVKLITRTDEDEIGSAKFNGVVWSVKAENDATIEAGEYAEVIAIDGNKLVVKHVKHESQQAKE